MMARMTLILNVLFAWISVALIGILSVIYLLRVVNKKLFDNQVAWMKRLNRSLRKHHKWLGVLAIMTSLIHGFYSSVKILTPNKGTIMLIMIMLLGASFVFKKQLKTVKGFMFYHRILTGLTVVFFCLHLIEVGGIIGPEAFVEGVIYEMTEPSTQVAKGTNETTESEQLTDIFDVSVQTEETNTADDEAIVVSDITEDVTEQLDSGNQYEDGVYTGEATGYRDGLVVEVTIEDHRIVLIEVVNHNEKNERFYGVPIATIPGEIVATQDPIVDTISGATMTSIGIINATIDALEQALISGTLPDYLDLPSRGRH